MNLFGLQLNLKHNKHIFNFPGNKSLIIHKENRL